MQLITVALLLSALLVDATPLDPFDDPRPSTPYDGTEALRPIKGACEPMYCLDVVGRGPCLQSCCRESYPPWFWRLTPASGKAYCRPGWSCSPAMGGLCCPPGWWCDGEFVKWAR